MAKNIVVCCDGTTNQIESTETNVLKFYRIMEKRPVSEWPESKRKKYPDALDQVCFYDPGVGTLSDTGFTSKIKSGFKLVSGMGMGYGLDRNVLDAYSFIVEHYERGDHLYLIGYSRGAYTARALAAFIHLIGVMRPDQLHLAPYAFVAYKNGIGKNSGFEAAYRFNEVLDTERPIVKFVGAWDTVGSLFVSQSYMPKLTDLPLVEENSSVQIFRHAIAIDERRKLFANSRWKTDQTHLPHPFSKEGVPQDAKEMWFVGCHSDIGGGNSEAQSHLSKIPFQWLANEAKEAGLVFRDSLFDMFVEGQEKGDRKRYYSKADPLAEINNSMTAEFRYFLEFFPRKLRQGADQLKEWTWYLAWNRFIPEKAELHPSVLTRLKERKDYQPKNLKNHSEAGKLIR